jgi:hypothetical protein
MKAFPTPTFSISEEARVTSIGGEGGMELRDYFAAKAVEGFCVVMSQRIRVHHDLIAADAYAMADAMMRAREKK